MSVTVTAKDALNPETEKVINSLHGILPQKEVIKNFFGLRDSIVMAEDGKTILEVFNEFVDPVILKEKGVAWNDRLALLGVTREYFDSLFDKYLNYGRNYQEADTPSDGETDTEPRVEDSKKATGGRKKTAKS